MKKIKPLSKKHRFRRWLRQVFGFKPPEYAFSNLLADLDEQPLAEIKKDEVN